MSSPTPYTISIPDSRLESLKAKLEAATFPDELDAANKWDRGAPLKDVKRLAEYWRDGFDWRKAEAKLNELPQYKTSVAVDGFGDVGVHFVHQKSEVEGAVPLLFSHGWPGSYIEVTKLLPLLKGDGQNEVAFNVVAPSLPNYGWSDAVKKPGFGIAQYAETFHKLMQSLGYTEYVTQGGDWGYFITRALGILYPQSVKASHINMLRPLNPPRFLSNPLLATKHALTPYSVAEKAGLERTKWFANEGSGYRMEQATKPQTLSYALADSPVAVLAWIYEKLHDWTDAYPWTDDEVLTWISIYWFATAGPAASVHIYYESQHPQRVPEAQQRFIGREDAAGYVPHVKLGVAHFPRELAIMPRIWAHSMGAVVHESVHERGGHFAAWERPDAVVADLKSMFGRKGPCFGIVEGRKGYVEGARL